MEKTFFALKHALEYAVVGVRGAPLYRFKKREPLAVVVPEDIRKFRGQPDLFYECDERGAPRDATAALGAQVPAPKSFKAFQPEPASAPAPREAPKLAAPPAPGPAKPTTADTGGKPQ